MANQQTLDENRPGGPRAPWINGARPGKAKPCSRGRFPWEVVADCVAWIVSDGARFLTGRTIVLDGGFTIRSPLTGLKDSQGDSGCV